LPKIGRTASFVPLRGLRALILLALGLVGSPGAGQAADIPSRAFDVPIDRVWTATESALKSLGWEIDQSDRAVGWILTDSRSVDFKEYAVYGKGLRHKLRLSLKKVGESRTLVSIERELYREERILWMIERTPVAVAERTVETGILDAIGQGL
jgi:hypothetical protein